MDAKKMGAWIAEKRKEKNLTQSQLADKLHVTDKAVSRWERGRLSGYQYDRTSGGCFGCQHGRTYACGKYSR